MTDYKPYEAMHMVFGEPEQGIADGQLLFPEREVYITDNDGSFTVFDRRDTILGSGTTVLATLESTGAKGWDFSRWDSAYDSQFAEVMDEDTWDPDYLREVAEEEDIMTDELAAVIDAYDAFYSA